MKPHRLSFPLFLLSSFSSFLASLYHLYNIAPILSQSLVILCVLLIPSLSPVPSNHHLLILLCCLQCFSIHSWYYLTISTLCCDRDTGSRLIRTYMYDLWGTRKTISSLKWAYASCESSGPTLQFVGLLIIQRFTFRRYQYHEFIVRYPFLSFSLTIGTSGHISEIISWRQLPRSRLALLGDNVDEEHTCFHERCGSTFANIELTLSLSLATTALLQLMWRKCCTLNTLWADWSLRNKWSNNQCMLSDGTSFHTAKASSCSRAPL